MGPGPDHLTLANKVANEFKNITSVEAIVLGGSNTRGSLDKHSDIDLYIYTREIIPLKKRQEIVKKLGASKVNMNLTFWDLGDEWFDLETGTEIDVMYWEPGWIEDQLRRVLVFHQANMGYTTCFWHTVLNSQSLFDRQGWFGNLQKRCKQPYPEELKRAILAKNHPVLRAIIPSYYGQIMKAIERQDLVSINHRLAALMASYFDVLFALNEVMHPGEKKILKYIYEKCAKVPVGLETQVHQLFQSAAKGDKKLLGQLDRLLDELDNLLVGQGFDPANTLVLDKTIE